MKQLEIERAIQSLQARVDTLEKNLEETALLVTQLANPSESPKQEAIKEEEPTRGVWRKKARKKG